MPVDAVVRAETESESNTRQEIQVYIGQVNTNATGQITFQFEVPTNASQLRVELATADTDISEMYNARTSFYVNPQQSSSGGSYLMAQILSHKIEVSMIAQ